MKKQKKYLIAAAAVIVLALVMAGLYFGSRKNVQDGSKAITVEVQHKNEKTKTIEIHTDAATLEEVLVDEKIADGDQSEFGLFITKVDGETADFDADGSWWKIQVNHEDATEGARSIPIEDGSVYSLIYTIS